MRYSILIALGIWSNAAFAQEVPVPDDLELSPIMEAIMAQGQDAAIQQLSLRFERYSDGDSIFLADLSAATQLRTAQDRAGKVAGYLAADLNWDGTVTRAELETFHAPNDPLFVDGYLRDGDLNADGQITLDEMLRDAAGDHPSTDQISDGILAEMVSWDFDSDGYLTYAELVSVILQRAQ